MAYEKVLNTVTVLVLMHDTFYFIFISVVAAVTARVNMSLRRRVYGKQLRVPPRPKLPTPEAGSTKNRHPKTQIANNAASYAAKNCLKSEIDIYLLAMTSIHEEANRIISSSCFRSATLDELFGKPDDERIANSGLK